MKHIFLIYGCILLAVLMGGTMIAESFSGARPYAAALVVLFSILADKATNK